MSVIRENKLIDFQIGEKANRKPKLKTPIR